MQTISLTAAEDNFISIFFKEVYYMYVTWYVHCTNIHGSLILIGTTGMAFSSWQMDVIFCLGQIYFNVIGMVGVN